MTSVKVGLKFVRNIGNYESIHVDVGVEDDVREGEKVSDAFERVYSFVETRLQSKVEEIDNDLNEK